MPVPNDLRTISRSAWQKSVSLVRHVPLWALIALVPGIALAATVKGQVKGHDRLINPVWAEAAKAGAHRFTWREPSPTVRADFRQLFGHAPKELCIAGISNQVVNPPPSPILVTIGGGRTTPVTIVIAPGTRLRFRNNDPFKHKLYAVGEASFPAVEMPIAGERDWTAPGTGGTFELRDELAPSLRSWVVVKAGTASQGYPGRDGQFVLNLAPGEYTLQPYFAGKPMGTPRTVTVASADMDLTKQPFELAEPSASAANSAGKK